MYNQNQHHIERIAKDDIIIEGTKKVANAINTYFTDKVENIIKNIKESQTDPITNYKKVIKTPSTKHKFKSVSLYRIGRIISKMNK